MPTTAAAIYCRISRDTEGAGLGVDRQERECRALADRLGWDVVEVLVDNDLSAYSGKRRPGYERMRQMLGDGTLGAVVAWAPDRLTRQTRELEDLIDLVDSAGVELATVTAGAIDLSTPSGRMQARIVGSVARYESEHKSARLKAKHRQLAESGAVAGGGCRAFGYADDRVTVVEAEAALIREALDRVLAGAGIAGICTDWTSRGITTTTGTFWRPFTIKRVLLSARIAGYREIPGGDGRPGSLVDAVWPSIVDRDRWTEARAILNDPNRRTNHRPTRYLLVGLAYDAHGQRMFARPNDRGHRCYITLRDGDTPGSRIEADPLEEIVVAAMLQRLDHASWPSIKAEDGGDAESVDRLVAELAELAHLHGDGSITTGEWMAARKPLAARLGAAEASAGDDARGRVLGRLFASPAPLRNRWPSFTFDQRREVLAAVIGRVTVAPGVRGRNRFDSSRVDVEWVV
jgi:site-specific DNA recombinase